MVSFKAQSIYKFRSAVRHFDITAELEKWRNSKETIPSAEKNDTSYHSDSDLGFYRGNSKMTKFQIFPNFCA